MQFVQLSRIIEGVQACRPIAFGAPLTLSGVVGVWFTASERIPLKNEMKRLKNEMVRDEVKMEKCETELIFITMSM